MSRELSSPESRNISTYVEQTRQQAFLLLPEKKHLHIRGADSTSWLYRRTGEETSDRGRNISTYVEQTHPLYPKEDGTGKHLHIRGADDESQMRSQGKAETSPHTWSRRGLLMKSRIKIGNISTYVEQTGPAPSASSHAWKHLHIRGADTTSDKSRSPRLETSPHTWSRLLLQRGDDRRRGNISTYVEQTASSAAYTMTSRKHLHIRGADGSECVGKGFHGETSPHTWSRLIFFTS